MKIKIKEDKDNEKLNFKKISNINKKNTKLKDSDDFSFGNKKKKISLSVGDDKE